MSTRKQLPPPKKKPTAADEVARVFVEALNDPHREQKDAEAVRERDQKLREALIAQGVLKKSGGKQ